MALFLCLIVSVLVLIFVLMLKSHNNEQRNKKHLQKYNIPFIQYEFKEFLHLITGQSVFLDTEKVLYKKAKQFENCPMVATPDAGSGAGYALYVTDLNLLKTIQIKAFDHFVNRRPVASQQTNLYFRKMMVSANDEQWKGIRVKLSPSFTTGKIKRMFQIFRKSSENISLYLKKYIGSNGMDLELSDILSKYTMDVIASCAFAIDSKAWEVPFGQISKFEQMGKEFQINFKPLNLLRFIVLAASPKLADLLGLEVLDKEAQSYFSGIIRQVLKHRRQTGERQEDFVQLMMDAQAGLLRADDQETNLVMYGTSEKDEKEESKSTFKINSKLTFDDDDLVANAMLFLLAGFDTTLSLLLFAIYSLALEPQVQEKLFQEVSTKMEENEGKLTYDSVLSMTYLDMVINETLRQYSPASRTERCCTKDFPVPGTNFVIKKGTIIIVPIYSIQNDEKYYDNPEKFIPERFSAENKESRNPYAFMPFGIGPRNCIGMRFALIESKAVLAQLVYNFRFAPCPKTKIPLEFSQAINLKPKDGLWLKIVPR